MRLAGVRRKSADRPIRRCDECSRSGHQPLRGILAAQDAANDIEGVLDLIGMKLASAVDMPDPHPPMPRVFWIIERRLYPESHDEDLIEVRGQLDHSVGAFQAR